MRYGSILALGSPSFSTGVVVLGLLLLRWQCCACHALSLSATSSSRIGNFHPNDNNRNNPPDDSNHHHHRHHTIVWFRSHALRTRDNAALRSAISSSSSSAKIHFIHLWDEDGSTNSISTTTSSNEGGTARHLFQAHALQSLNETLGGGLVVLNASTASKDNDVIRTEKPPNSGDDGDSPSSSWNPSIVDTLHRFIQTLSSSTVVLYYLENLLDDTADKLQRQLRQRQASCNIATSIEVQSFHGDQTLLDYKEQNVVDLLCEAIQRHPFRSPLIPFVDMVVKSLREQEEEQQQYQQPPQMAQPSLVGSAIDQNCNNATRARLECAPDCYIQIHGLLERLGTTRNTDWGRDIVRQWPASEEAAHHALDEFVDSQYTALINIPKIDGDKKSEKKRKKTKRPNHLVSRLSPYLSTGLLSPRQVYQALQLKQQDERQLLSLSSSSLLVSESGSDSFLRRLAWRDYAYAATLVFRGAVVGRKPIRSMYQDSSCRIHNDEMLLKHLQAWKDGNTGYPLVDAGMRQLKKEGFMPQQVRLVASACLVEGLNVPWEYGMRHFEEYLVDFDVIINTHMWQNAGSVGLDPYYIGLDFKKRPYWDSDGSYIRKWCPELKLLPNDLIEIPPATKGVGGTNKVDALYNPWRAPPEVLKKAHVILCETYPRRIVDERDGRRAFLQNLRDRRFSWEASHIDNMTGDDIISVGGKSTAVFTPRSLKISVPR